MGKSIVVISASDSGPGTLRQALLEAQPGDIITFDPSIFSPEAPVTISLSSDDGDSALPNITVGDLTIDASNAGVILDGSGIQGAWVNGLEIYSSGNVVRGLQVIGFSGSGIVICGGSDNTIGGDRDVGNGPLGQGNRVSGNHFGIDLCSGGSNNTITGNIVGGSGDGSGIWGNKAAGILFEDGMTNNTVGPGNIIAQNRSAGVLISGAGSQRNTITGNSFFSNAVGIRLADGANAQLAPPVITGFDLASGEVSGHACANCVVEIFSSSGLEGEFYEGQTLAESSGFFTFDTDLPLAGPYVFATATDPAGNTSEFPPFVAGYDQIQVGNKNPGTVLTPSISAEIDDNRIGIHTSGLWVLQPEVFPDGSLDPGHIFGQGVKRARISINNLDFDSVNWDAPEIPIRADHDAFITSLADSGITLTYVLTFWDKEYVAEGGVIPSPRFKTEDEINRYLEFVRYMVRELKDRVVYFEIWNEPNSSNSIQSIDVEDYINLVVRTVPVIRDEYPEAKIIVGGVGDIRVEQEFEYFARIIGSDKIMPIVDVVSWHGMYDTSPQYDYHRHYYYDYPAIVARIKETARSHGFTGEFVSDELSWRTTPCYCRHEGLETLYSETEAAKYYARGILMNLGLDLFVSQFYVVPGAQPLLIVNTIRNLSTVMAGFVPTDLSVRIESEATGIVSYAFSNQTGDVLLALWNDGVAADVDLGVNSTVIVPGLSIQETIAIDVLYGFEQQVITDNEDGDLVIRDLRVNDYPIVLRFKGASSP